jgi:ABC-type uncharacterized transport system permease subunit
MTWTCVIVLFVKRIAPLASLFFIKLDRYYLLKEQIKMIIIVVIIIVSVGFSFAILFCGKMIKMFWDSWCVSERRRRERALCYQSKNISQ